MTNDIFMDVMFTVFILAGGTLLLGSFFCNKEKEEQVHVIQSRKVELWLNNQDNKKIIMDNINESSSGFWFLVSGFWFLVSGFWFLVSGFWFLVSGTLSVNGPLNTNSTPPYTHAESSFDLSIPNGTTLDYLCRNDEICSNAQKALHSCMEHLAYIDTGYTVLLHVGDVSIATCCHIRQMRKKKSYWIRLI